MIDKFVKLSVKKSSAVTTDPLCSSLIVSMYMYMYIFTDRAQNKSKERSKLVLPFVPVVVAAAAFAAHYAGLS